MPKSYVLKALKLLSLEEILKLTTAVKMKTGLLKKAAGQELVSWESTPAEKAQTEEGPSQNDRVSADILPFTKLRPKENEKEKDSSEKSSADEEGNLNIVSSEFILWQRELSRDPSGPLQTKQAVKGYTKSTEMYVVKTPSNDGKDKIRFASTQGVLVNKKQA